jgi:putative ABC transport system ATP-binding protein
MDFCGEEPMQGKTIWSKWNPAAADGHSQEQPLIQLRHVCKTYHTGGEQYPALTDIDLEVENGEFVAIIGKSGSGKSTLINMITGIDRPTSGEILIDAMPIHRWGENKKAIWRGKTIGIVFQFFQLVPTLTILENVELPMDLCHTGSFWTRR